MLSRFTIQRAKYYAPNWFDCLIVCPFWVKSGNCVGILSDQGEAATASNVSEYTISGIWSSLVDFALTAH